MFSSRLKEEREFAGLTQKELAEKIDVTAGTVGLYEQNRRSPDYDILIKLADIFNVTLDYLIGRTNSKKEVIPPPEKGQALIMKAEKANVSIAELEIYIETRKKAQDIND